MTLPLGTPDKMLTENEIYKHPDRDGVWSCYQLEDADIEKFAKELGVEYSFVVMEVTSEGDNNHVAWAFSEKYECLMTFRNIMAAVMEPVKKAKDNERKTRSARTVIPYEVNKLTEEECGVEAFGPGATGFCVQVYPGEGSVLAEKGVRMLTIEFLNEETFEGCWGVMVAKPYDPE